LRCILAGYSDTAASELRFGEGACGKPELLPASPLRFNLAHAEGRAALAVAWREVGIDLEPIQPDLDLAPLMSTACTPGEQVRLAARPAAPRGGALLTTRPVQEAYHK
jgi:4'-phosphopantetheinyl transferase